MDKELLTPLMTIDIIYLQNNTYETPTAFYPNPAHDILTYEGVDATLTFFDMYGRQIMQQNTSGDKTSIDISNLEIGIYTVEISNNVNRTVRRFVKK